MHTTLATLLDRLDSKAVEGTDVIRWGCPIPAFGDAAMSRVATLGLNPSNREFMDESGRELRGLFRRFHTLNSLGLGSWSEVNAHHLRVILDSCYTYFRGNPYDAWFRRLDRVVSGARASYYDDAGGACHLDLIPYATRRKWTDLRAAQRSSLLAVAADSLGLMLRDSSIRVLILNGRSVVDHLEEVANIKLERRLKRIWSLRRESGLDVAGMAYEGVIDKAAGIDLGREVLILGYNHNLQSSFGVTTQIIQAIRSWVSRTAEGTSW